MIKIHEKFGHQKINLGNKLFIYGLARYVAEFHGYKLDIGKYFLIYRDQQVYNFPYGNIDGKEILQPKFELHEWIDYSLEKLVKDCKGKYVDWVAYYLRYDLIKPIKGYIKNLYKDLTLTADNKNDVIILLRSSNTDPTFVLPDEYYESIIKTLKFENLYISYDHLENHTSILEKLKIYNPILLNLNSIELLKTITSKKILVCCQGTFSFWAAFLTNAEKIYWPITKTGPNRLTDASVQLKIDDDERIEFVNIW
jgi:hypothetical protein